LVACANPVDGDNAFLFSSRRRHTRSLRDWSSDVCSSDLPVLRHYGFGATQQNGTLAAGGVTIGGVNAPVSSWSDTQIVVSVPSGVPPCTVQQQAQYGGSAAQCGELVIKTGGVRTEGNVTGVTITRGGSYNT